jgi:hypothetical protein
MERVSDSELRCPHCGLGARTTALVTVGRDPSAPPTAAELAEQLAFDRDRARMNAITYDAAPFRPYGLDERWTGTRWFSGHGETNGMLSHLDLAHGNWPIDRTAPEARIATHVPSPVFGVDGLEQELHSQGRMMVSWLWHETAAVPEAVRRATHGYDHPPDDSVWDEQWITVGGMPVRFRILRAAHAAIALAVVGVFIVSIQARTWDFDAYGLEEIDDFWPYQRGSVEIHQRMRRRRS